MQKLWRWWVRKKPKEQLLEKLAAARAFEEWEAIAIKLDEVLGNDLWCVVLVVFLWFSRQYPSGGSPKVPTPER